MTANPSPAPWYSPRVAEKRSVVLSDWMDRRGGWDRIGNASAVYPTSSGTKGSQLYEWLVGGMPSIAGPAVTERTAMAISAVYASIGLIAGALSQLPFRIYQRGDADSREAVRHDYWWILNEQSAEAWSAAVAREYLVWSLLLHGDAFAEIQRASPLSPRIIGLEPIHPDLVSVHRNGKRRAYTWTDANGQPIARDQDDVLHIPGLGFDGLRGLSPLRYAARNQFGTALAADEWASRFFANGGRPDYVVTTKAKMDQGQLDTFRDTWRARYGGVQNAHIPAILSGEGADVKSISLKPADAQLIETRQWQAGDIARIYGVPPHMIGILDKSTSWGSGIEQQNIGFRVHTLGRHIVKIDQEVNRKFWPARERYFAELDTAGLERGDYKSRNEGYRIALGRAGEPGWLSVNEVRKFENLSPVEGGDEISSGEPAAEPENPHHPRPAPPPQPGPPGPGRPQPEEP